MESRRAKTKKQKKKKKNTQDHSIINVTSQGGQLHYVKSAPIRTRNSWVDGGTEGEMKKQALSVLISRRLA